MPQPKPRTVTFYADLPGNSAADNFFRAEKNAKRTQSTSVLTSCRNVRTGEATPKNRPSCPNGHSSVQAGSGSLLQRFGMGTLNLLTANFKEKPMQTQQEPRNSVASRPKSFQASPENLLAVLGRFDTLFLVDDSASMKDMWSDVKTALMAISQKAIQYDSDGIDVYFLNTTTHVRGVHSAHQIESLFRRVHPVGPSTPLEVRVEYLLGLYLDRLEYGKARGMALLKPLNLVVITDGVADDPDSLAMSIQNAAQRLDEGRYPLQQVGIQFIQIGRNSQATRFLEKLDNDIKSSPRRRRDIVDTVSYKGQVTSDFVLKSLLGGINRRVDRDHRGF